MPGVFAFHIGRPPNISYTKNTMLLCILGRQARLGLAELESLCGHEAVRPLGASAALVDVEQLNHKQLGGTIKVAEVLQTITTTLWPEVSEQLTQLAALHYAGTGKLRLGLSGYELRASPTQLSQLAFQLKKTLHEAGRSVRIVPTRGMALNSAQVLHNRLDRPGGAEIVLLQSGGKTYIAQTISEQLVDSYAKRDFERPKRDARVGMLPPKLAQIMLNLAKPVPNSPVLDPFCGTGVVLMEAALQGHPVVGSDLNPTMILYTQTNLDWLAQHYRLTITSQLSEADATTAQWINIPKTVVCETYLGRPLNNLPDTATLKTIITDCNTIISKFLANLHKQLPPGARCCIAVPAWVAGKQIIHLPLVDDLKKMGYNRIRFSHARSEDLVYYRPDQTVARELLVLTRM